VSTNSFEGRIFNPSLFPDGFGSDIAGGAAANGIQATGILFLRYAGPGRWPIAHADVFRLSFGDPRRL
jgi:hypothetical protein